MGSVIAIPARSKSVVITGTSSGLGRAAALRLADLGYRVVAGIRTESDAADLAGLAPSTGELIPVLLDVTDTASIARAGQIVERICGDTGLWAVVNNAGIAVSAPLECVSLDMLRAQLETNVVGAVAVVQQFLPLLRASGGRILSVSSGIANIAPPFLGPYAAAQFAKEGLSDALRRELRPLGVDVSVIQPGAIHTELWSKMRRSADEVLAAAPAEAGAAYRRRFLEYLDTSAALTRANRTTPAHYADTVAAALAAKRPKIRYRVGLDSRGSAFARRVVPDRMMDALLSLGAEHGSWSAPRPRSGDAASARAGSVDGRRS